METIIFLGGISLGICLMIAYFALRTGRKEYPFRTAFGLAMLMYAGVYLSEYVITCLLGIDTPKNPALYICIDISVIPFFILEVWCIKNQDMDHTPWNKRLLQPFLMLLPLMGVSMLSLRTDRFDLLPWAVGLFILYSLIWLTYLLYANHQYSKMLKKERTGKHRDMTWLLYIFAIRLFQCLLYMLSTRMVWLVVFELVSIASNLLHAYFIRKQSPVNTRSLRELSAEDRQIISELEEVTQELRHKDDIENRIKAFELQHPGFTNRLRALTETKLTQRDIFLSILIYEGHKNPEIAELLAISTSSVEVARYRLRTKLNLDKGVNLGNLLKGL